MYLSQLHIVWNKSKNPYDLHRAIWTLFPGPEDQERDFLFRVESLERDRGARVLMLSQTEPQQEAEHCRLMALKEWNPKFAEGQAFRFRLRVNPVKSVKDESKGMRHSKHGYQYPKQVRIPLIHEEQQQAWLERKLSGIADIDYLMIQQEMPLNFTKPGKEKRMAGKIQPVLFDGVLVVKSPEGLVKCVTEGIGPAKAFGCGLLSLART